MVLVVSVLPARWLTPWTGRLGELVGLPLVPLGDGMTAVRIWLEGEPPGTVDSVEADQLWKEVAYFRRELSAAREKIRSLRAQLAAVQQFEDLLTDEGLRPRTVIARTVRTTPTRSGEHLVVVNKGRGFGVTPGAIAIHNEDILVGYVLEGVGSTTATIRPLPSVETGRIRGIIASDDDSNPVQVMLAPEGDGWTSAIPTAMKQRVTVGSMVRLSDDRWRWAQGYRIGRVAGIEPLESNPTLQTLTIEPLADPQEVRSLLLICDPPEGAG
ncbi:MAG: hypothetical protein CMJ51_05005 [Planctomycetaceae bacterium]|nr:hypothetical protein [Planctomycetaceae bacterium]